MKPMTTEETAKEDLRQSPGISLSPSAASYSSSNRRATTCGVQRVYPWLLFASTAVAATFCLAYITKPIILASPSPAPIASDQKPIASLGNRLTTKSTEKILPDPNLLPGDTQLPSGATTGSKSPASSQNSDFEETNIRVQHVLDAESANGEVDRIIVDVPVVYRSRSLRWTQDEATEARKLLDLLSAHQEKTRILRDEGAELLDSWNKLMGTSVPSAALRADSPSLPANQFNPLAPDGAAAAETIEAIKLTKPEK